MMRSINELEDEVHCLLHPDDHECDTQVLEEGDEDEEGVMLWQEERINGLMFSTILGFSIEEHGFPIETLDVMPVEFFGSRHQGRTSSIDKSFGQNW